MTRGGGAGASALLHGDWHVHSTFSDDAHDSLLDNVEAARRVGLHEIRLIDHVRRTTAWVPEYLAEVAALPDVDGLRVHTGVEAKILDTAGTLDIPEGLVVGAGGVDAVVIADHQFPGPNGPWSPERTRQHLAEGLAVGDALDMLVGALVGAMRSVRAAQLAHCFSILPKIGLSEDDLSDAQLRVWAETAADTGTVAEVNEKWACPGPRALRSAVDAGVRLVASTDSHRASDIGRYSVVPRMLTEAGLR